MPLARLLWLACMGTTGKRSLNAAVIRSAKGKGKAITLDVKLEVLRRFEVGEKLSQIAKALGLATSTVATTSEIIKHKNQSEFTNSYSFESSSWISKATKCRSHGDHGAVVALVAWKTRASETCPECHRI